MSRRSPRPKTRKQAGCAGIQPETDRLARSYLDLLCHKEAVRRQSRRDAGLEGADKNAGKSAADTQPDLPSPLPIRPDLAAIAILTARAIERADGLADKLSAGQPVVVIKTGDKEHVPLAGTVASSCCISADRKVRHSNIKRKGSNECIVIEAKDARRTSVSLYDDDVLEALGAGCSLVGISPDPETLLPKTLLHAADHRISLPKLDASAIRLTIATLVGAVPETGISDDIAARLDVTDLAVAVRPGRTADDCIAALKKIAAGNAADGPRGPRLDELPGYGAARIWGLEAAEDLNALKGGRITWADFDHRGLLLSGPPGTGKTLFATALANSAGVPLIATSVASWSTKSYLSGMEDAGIDVDRKKLSKAPGRFYICTAICAATKVFLGAGISASETAEAALMCTRQILLDKSEIAAWAGCKSSWEHAGIPERLVTDQGSGFIDQSLVPVLTTLGVEHHFPRGGSPQSKPFVENSFRAIEDQLVATQYGRSFSNSVERGDYPSERLAALNLDGFYSALIRYLVDVKMNTAHRGLDGETPREAWTRKSAMYGLAVPPGADAIRGIFSKRDEATLSGRGIMWEGFVFHSEELTQQLLDKGPGTTLEVRADPNDISALSVYTGDRWITVPNVESEAYGGLSLDQYRFVEKRVQSVFAGKAAGKEDIAREALRHFEQLRHDTTTKNHSDAVAMNERQIKRTKHEFLRKLVERDKDDIKTNGKPAQPLKSLTVPVGQQPERDPPPDDPDPTTRPSRQFWTEK